MTGFDFAVLGILAASGVLGLARGLLKEMLSLAAYALAFVAAIWWGGIASGWLVHLIENPLLRAGAAYAAVFVATLLAVGLVNMALAALIRVTGLSPADHGLGGIFGLIRGLLIILALVVVCGYTTLPKEPWWQDAKFSPLAVEAVQQVKSRLPHSLAQLLPPNTQYSSIN